MGFPGVRARKQIGRVGESPQDLEQARDHNMALSTLVYVSVAARPQTEDDLEKLLTFARANNSKHSITGMLLYRDGLFVQALEGEQEDIQALFEKIKVDKRHRNVTKIHFRPIKERSFGDWSMGFVSPKDDDLKQIEGYSDFLEHPSIEYFGKKPGYAQALLENFRVGYFLS